MTDALCETSRSLSPFLIQDALLLATTSRDLSSLGCAQERPWKSRGRRSCLYPKKSSEGGRNEDFSSLDAQYEGWKLIKKRYDDGCISVGTLERPAPSAFLAY